MYERKGNMRPFMERKNAVQISHDADDIVYIRNI